MSATETKTLDPLLWIQEEVRDFLLKDPWFDSLKDSILLSDRGDILSALDQTVAKLGLAIIVEPSEVDLQYCGDNIVLNFDQNNPLTVIVWESVLSNRSVAGTRRRASEVAIKIAKQFRPGQTPAAPCTFIKGALMSDSGGKCVYTLKGVGTVTL